MGNSSDKISLFEPKNLDVKNSIEVKRFEPRNLNSSEMPDYKNVKKAFGSLASTDPEKKDSFFTLHPDSKRLLGVENAEKNHLEGVVQDEVNARVEAIREEARQAGYEVGAKEGLEKAHQEATEKAQILYDRFSGLMSEIDQMKHEFWAANERVIVQMILMMARRVILRELETDKDYVKRLAANVIEKIGVRDYVKIKVSKEDFQAEEQLRAFLKTQFIALKNIQIQPSDELSAGGCTVETDLANIDASFDQQWESIKNTLESL